MKTKRFIGIILVLSFVLPFLEILMFHEEAYWGEEVGLMGGLPSPLPFAGSIEQLKNAAMLLLPFAAYIGLTAGKKRAGLYRVSSAVCFACGMFALIGELSLLSGILVNGQAVTLTYPSYAAAFCCTRILRAVVCVIIVLLSALELRKSFRTTYNPSRSAKEVFPC